MRSMLYSWTVLDFILEIGRFLFETYYFRKEEERDFSLGTYQIFQVPGNCLKMCMDVIFY